MVIKPNKRLTRCLKIQIEIAAFIVFLAPLARSQGISGTSVIVKWNQEKIIVVTDSRVSTVTGRKISDDDCKISTLSNEFFVASAYTRKMDATTNGRRMVWDSQETAKRAFEMSAPRSVEAVAAKWGEMWTHNLNQIKVGQRSGISSEMLFAGLNNGGIDMIVGRVFLDNNLIFGFNTVKVPYNVVAGMARGTDIVSEFQEGKTSRSQRELQDWKKSLGNPTIDEFDRKWLIQLMRWVIKYDNGGWVGGQPEAIELRNNGSVQWLESCTRPNQ